MSSKDIYDRSVEGVCSLIWDLEREFDLFSKEEDGVYFWRLVRFHLYYSMVQEIGIFGAPHPSHKFSLKKIISQFKGALVHSVLNHPCLNRRAYKYAVMPHTRQVNDRDIYSDELLQNLDKNQTLLIYKSLQGSLYPEGYSVLLDRLLRRYKDQVLGRRYALSENNAALVATIEMRIKAAYPLKLNLRNFTEGQIASFQQNVEMYRALFMRKKVQHLFVVIGYTCQGAVHAAHQCGIKVTELQHGTITKYHLGYSFPVSGDVVPYFPDRMLCFGKFWIDYTPLPQHMISEIIGAPYIKELLASGSVPEKKPKTIVFASQGVIGKLLFPFASACAVLLPDYTFIYRLHPSESLDDYKNMSIPQNFAFSTNSPDIFSLLRETEFHAGVFSTTLIEGMVLGCRTIVIDMAGYEYMMPVIEAGDALFVHTPEEFAEKIIDAPLCNDTGYYYGEKDLDFSWSSYLSS
ncbi:MAG: hypothetical protein PHX61_01780 [Alphaproteobacteria bacterium]|nr:hypothetical protein [Alphaproteobacteria bacterium]